MTTAGAPRTALRARYRRRRGDRRAARSAGASAGGMSGDACHCRRAGDGNCGAHACCATSTVSTREGSETLAVDTLAISGGWNPDVSLTCHHGARPVWSEDIAAFVPEARRPA